MASMPHIVVKYDDESGSKTYCDSQLPHRGFDGHIRVGVHDGKSTSEAKEYIDARNSTLENLLPLFELSPVTVLFGGWDSTRSKNQLRIPSVLTGEMYGVLADQSDDDPAIHRAGARIDPVGASVSVAKKADREKIVGDSIDLDYVPKETEGLAGYRPPFVHSERALEAPWTRVIVMSVTVDEGHQGEKSEWKPSESEYVGWAVALHRFLVKQWGVDPAPSLVGKYVSGIKRPANNVAIQILDSELKSSYGIQLRDDVARKLPGFLIMLPKDMPQHDMQKLYDVCKRSKGKTLYFSQAVPKLRLGESALIDAEHLWKPVSVDFVRYWMPRPLAIAETRPIPDPKKKRHWRAAESMYLALGHVWRDKYVPNDIQGTRESRYWETVDAVADQSSNFRIREKLKSLTLSIVV